ncbi:MAG TPA: OmpH family outer membrane protein [Gammaproteobacteria bacterium]|nr:OmpH family outer membrane protein [Gammaproteobacteria bacterium]
MIRTPIAARAWGVPAFSLAALAGLMLCTVFAGPASAARDSLKIGVVNVATLLQQAPQAQKTADALQTEFAPRQRKLLNMQQDLQKKQDQYKRDAAVMGAEEKANLEREIRDGQRDFQRAYDELQQDVNDRKNEELSKLQKSLLQEVQSYARAKGYDLVVSDVLYYSDAVDITKEVLEAMKSSAGKAKGK